MHAGGGVLDLSDYSRCACMQGGGGIGLVSVSVSTLTCCAGSFIWLTTSMGSPLAPTLSNLFMGVLENKYLRNPRYSKVSFYKRYVDDILLVFDNDGDVSSFFEFMNSWHPNIRFTKEVGDKQIPFLDIDIKIENNILDTTVYRKPTYTNLLLNFKALCPMHWKTGLLITLLHRAYLVCNSWTNFHDEVTKLIHIFNLNGYPIAFIHKHIKSFLNNKFKLSNNDNLENDSLLANHIIKIPFIGLDSIILKKKIRQCIKKINRDFNVSVVFITEKLGNCFSLKDKTPMPLLAGVVYKFSCEVDPQHTYIGKTIRHLSIRIKEHKTNVSAIYDHRMTCNCKCNIDNFEILNKSNEDFSLKILEAIYIKRNNPSLNKQLHNDGSFFACKLN